MLGELNARVSGLIRALLRLKDDVYPPKSLQDIGRVVGRVVVNDDDLDPAPRIIER